MPQHLSEEDEVNVWFEVRRFEAHPSVATQLMQLQPTEIWVAGELNFKQPRRPNQWSAWRFDSPLPKAAPTEEHLEALLSTLEPRAEAISTLAKVYQAEVGINCVIYYRHRTPGIHFSRDVARRLGNLSLWFELNFYLQEAEADE